MLESLITQKDICKRELSAQTSAKFSSVSELKNFIISSHSEKFDAPTSAFENHEIGFYDPPRGTRFVTGDEATLAEAYLTEKINGW